MSERGTDSAITRCAGRQPARTRGHDGDRKNLDDGEAMSTDTSPPSQPPDKPAAAARLQLGLWLFPAFSVSAVLALNPRPQLRHGRKPAPALSRGALGCRPPNIPLPAGLNLLPIPCTGLELLKTPFPANLLILQTQAADHEALPNSRSKLGSPCPGVGTHHSA